MTNMLGEGDFSSFHFSHHSWLPGDISSSTTKAMLSSTFEKKGKAKRERDQIKCKEINQNSTKEQEEEDKEEEEEEEGEKHRPIVIDRLPPPSLQTLSTDTTIRERHPLIPAARPR